MAVAMIDACIIGESLFLHGWNLGNMYGEGVEKMIPLEDMSRPNTLPVTRRRADG